MIRCIPAGQDVRLADWVARRIPHVGSADGFGAFFGFAVIDDMGKNSDILAGAIYHGWIPDIRNIQLSFASVTPRWATRGAIREILAYPFVQGGPECDRITCWVEKRNKRARHLLSGLGFVLEGRMRLMGGSLLLFGALRRDLKPWITGESLGQEGKDAAAA